ncbi:hypothetical protein OG871_07020 [Kitasatospora sp. NBC_00374]|uniref:hypothetical protein n=1 Tax=Kitasatospora sp. NBC_00374 TaxID=2975964 RepID=UPI00324B4A65
MFADLPLTGLCLFDRRVCAGGGAALHLDLSATESLDTATSAGLWGGGMPGAGRGCAVRTAPGIPGRGRGPGGGVRMRRARVGATVRA